MHTYLKGLKGAFVVCNSAKVIGITDLCHVLWLWFLGYPLTTRMLSSRPLFVLRLRFLPAAFDLCVPVFYKEYWFCKCIHPHDGMLRLSSPESVESVYTWQASYLPSVSVWETRRDNSRKWWPKCNSSSAASLSSWWSHWFQLLRGVGLTWEVLTEYRRSLDISKINHSLSLLTGEVGQCYFGESWWDNECIWTIYHYVPTCLQSCPWNVGG